MTASTLPRGGQGLAHLEGEGEVEGGDPTRVGGEEDFLEGGAQALAKGRGGEVAGAELQRLDRALVAHGHLRPDPDLLLAMLAGEVEIGAALEVHPLFL